MASSINAIGFDDLTGDLLPLERQLEAISRPGVDYEELRDTGLRADESVIRTSLYCVSRAVAITAINTCIALKDGNPYVIIQNDQSYGYFRVLRVLPRALIPCTSVIGSIASNPTVMLPIDWVVIASPAP